MSEVPLYPGRGERESKGRHDPARPTDCVGRHIAYIESEREGGREGEREREKASERGREKESSIVSDSAQGFVYI